MGATFSKPRYSQIIYVRYFNVHMWHNHSDMGILLPHKLSTLSAIFTDVLTLVWPTKSVAV